MKLSYYLKIKAYRFFHTSLGEKILEFLSKFISVKNLARAGSPKYPFIVSITIDTESGYVDENDRRIWQYFDPKAYMGYYMGINNWRDALNSHGAKATFFLSTNCFSAKGAESRKIMQQLRLLLKEKHEIGLHMHPDSDLALQKELGEKFQATSSKFYTEDEINALIAAGKKIITKNLKMSPVSFRWGNWGLTTNCVAPLENNGFKIDSSATPGIKGHQNDSMIFDWSQSHSHYPWILSESDYQDTKAFDSNILEMPIATFSFFGMTLRADPANSSLLKGCFDYYYKNSDRSKKPFVFVVISHSIEGTHKDGAKTKVLDVISDFIMHSKKYNDVKFKTLKESSHFFDATMK